MAKVELGSDAAESVSAMVDELGMKDESRACPEEDGGYHMRRSSPAARHQIACQMSYPTHVDWN